MATNYWLDQSGDWTATANWSTGSVPATGDTVYILSGSQAIATDLNQSGVTLAALYIGMGFTGTIGTSSADLQISATNLYIGMPVTGPQYANGASRIRINLGSVASTILIYNTCSSTADTGFEPVRIIGTGSNVISVLSGLVGVATTLPTQTATITTANVAGGTLNFGYGVTWTTADVSNSAKFTAQTGGTTLSISSGGTATINGTAAVTTVNNSGTAYLNQRPASGSLSTTINTYEGGTTDFSYNPATGTVGTHNLYAGATCKTCPAVPNHITTTTLNLVNSGTLSLN